jgi:uncharacterized protein (TIGR03067 family)
MGGQKIPESALTAARLEIEGVRFFSRGMGAVYEGVVSLNAAENPKQIDMQFDAGPEKGNTNFGIYSLAQDSLTLCLDISGKARPDEFTSANGFALETLVRETS